MSGLELLHRNIGRGKEDIVFQEWIAEAKKLHDEAIEKAKKLSPSAGARIEWLGTVTMEIPLIRVIHESEEGQELKHWLAMLETVERRILGIMEQTL